MIDFDNFPVFQVIVVNDSIDKGGSANAVLVDKERGLFVTAAHVVDPFGRLQSTEHHIHLPHTGKFHRAHVEKHWIDWNCDRAYLRLSEDLSSYQQAETRKNQFKELESAKIIGISKQNDTSFIKLINFDTIVQNPRSGYGVSSRMMIESLEIKQKNSLSNLDKKKLYKEFVLFKGDRSLVPSMSGCALVDDDGRLAGIVSMGGPSMGLAFPAFEIQPDKLVLDARPAPGKGLFSWLKRPAGSASGRKLG